MARKTILVCDNCGKEVPESRGAVMRLNYTDARRGSWSATGKPANGRFPRPAVGACGRFSVPGPSSTRSWLLN